jgi:ribosomal protein S12 methylthiotransferase
MVGFPGETNSDFERMLDFIERVRFDHMGAFVYSGEEDIPSNRLEDHVAEEVKQERFERLMKRQAEISRENNQRYVGETLQVLVEGASESCAGPMVGRAAFQAPDVDGVVHVSEGTIDPGSFATVRITQAHDYDLTGDMV